VALPTAAPARPRTHPHLGGSALAGGASATAPAAFVAKASATALATKLGLAGLLTGGALFVGTLASQPEPTLEATAPSEIISQAPVDDEGGHFTLPTSIALGAPAERRDVKEATSATHESTPAENVESRRAPVVAHPAMREGEGVQRARAELAAGRPAAALAELNALDREVPRGMLGQERQVLAIEALAASGQSGAAGRLASAFVEAHPTSPYADRVRRFAR